MDKKYITGGTIQTCPLIDKTVIIAYSDNCQTFDRSQCPNFHNCTDDICLLCDYLKS